jgi:hypothetical protein
MSGLFFLVGAFFFDSGRRVLLNTVTKYLKTQGIIFIIDGLDRKITKIHKIYIQSPSGIELTFSDITLQRKYIIDKSSIYVENFTLNGASDEIDLDEKLKELIPLMRKLRFFIDKLSLGKGLLYLGKETYSLDNLRYQSHKNEDVLYSEISKRYFLNVIFKWKINECVESNISFSDFSNSKGDLFIKSPESGISNFALEFNNKNFKIQSNGCFANFMKDIVIKNVFIEHSHAILEGAGNLFLQGKKINIVGQVIPKKEKIQLIPTLIAENFTDVTADLNLSGNFFKDIVADFIFKRSQLPIGKLNCLYKGDKLKVSGDIGWINIVGYNLSNLICEYHNKKANVKLLGKDFEIISDIGLNGKISVDSLLLRSEKGFIKASSSFLITDNLNCGFDFNFSKMDFWNKIAPISGTGSGKILYKNKIFSVNGIFQKLCLKGNKFRDIKISYDNRAFNLIARKAEAIGIHMRNLEFNLFDNNFSIFGKMHDGGTIKSKGTIENSYCKILLENCSILHPDSKVVFRKCRFDSSKNDLRLYCDISGEKGDRIGSAEIVSNFSEMKGKFSKFPLDKFLKLFGYHIRSGKLDGDLKLKSENENYIGNGKLILSNLLGSKQSLEANLELLSNGTRINANLKKYINVSAFFPINFKSNGSIARSLDKPIDCRIQSNTRLRDILNLSDRIDLSGNLNCDLRVSGTFSKPIISGNAELKNAFIAVGDLFLKNRIISLIGNGEYLNVVRCDFIDHRKRKAKILGNGKLFFDGIIPNINANLQMEFDNFTLFDSDDFSAIVTGTGTMSGPLNNMVIRGDVTIPKCSLQNFASGDKKPDITIENDPYFAPHFSLGNDFFEYDVKMHCSDVKVASSVFEIHLRGDLLLTTFNDESALDGTLRLSSGKLDLFGRRMKFIKGDVIFQKEFPFTPKIDLISQRNLGDISVSFNIKSTPKKGISFDLHSTPSYTQDVILARMLFGKELKYLNVTEAAQLAHAIAGLKQQGYIFSVLDTFKNLGIVDNISFSDGKEGQSSLYSDSRTKTTQGNMSLSAGKYINDNIFISVQKKEEGASFNIDFSITPQISIKANTTGETGISWKYRY